MLAPLLIASSLVLATLSIEPPPAQNHSQIAGTPDLKANAADLKQTLVVPTIEHVMGENQNLLWCATMPMAWQELSLAMGGPLTTDAKSKAAAMIAELNATASTKADIDETSYVAMAGFGKDDIIKRIRDALQERFKGAASPSVLPREVGSDEIFAYSYLFKNLEFADPFIRRKVALDFGGKPVSAFGLWSDYRIQNWSTLAKQVSILSYTSPTQWTVELKTKAAGDRLIIARLDKGKTLAATIESALGAAKDTKPVSMDHADELIVPLLNFDITRSFNELSGATLKGSKMSGPVLSAIQNIRFRLDEKGAVLKSDVGLRTGSAMPQNPRRMVCDGPFLVVMSRADAKTPYYAAWVDNPEILVPFKK